MGLAAVLALLLGSLLMVSTRQQPVGRHMKS